MIPEVLEGFSEAISGRYRIVRQIGAGGMATVYLADDLKLDRSVAIKVLRPELAASVTGTRFLREIRIAAGLAHPHIVPVHDSGEADGLLFFVMRFQEGESLRALLNREGALPIARTVDIARDVAKGLAYAHEHGVIHRDIKPANILLTGEHAVIADFGVARALEVSAIQGSEPRITSAALGTPLYMSPEQVSASPDIDGRSDIYSLGCVMYEMLTGEPPFLGENAVAVLASHVRKGVRSVRDLRSEVPLPLAETVHQALRKSPDDRFETASDLCHTLESAQSGLENLRLPIRTRWKWLPRRVRRVVSAAAGLSAIVLTVTLGYLIWPPGPSPDPSSMVVIPFRDPITTSEEERLLVSLADELTRQLNRWESVSAVQQIALSGVRFDLGIQGPTLERIDEGLAVAQALGAGTLVNLSVKTRGDSLLVSADLINAQTGRGRGKPREAWGEVRDPIPIAADVAHLILGLEGPASEIARLYRLSAVPEALIEWESGRMALEGWRLRAAESFFRAATGLDPAFALAHHHLALTLYWEWVEGRLEGDIAGPQIALGSTSALRNSAGLSMGDSLHILAFNRFQAGDYDGARDHYRTLLERDSADVYAWLLQGSVEYTDPWLMQLPSGELRPRGNLNLARRSFDETVRLSPGIQGAYGQVLDIAAEVASAAEERSAPTFELPRGEFLAPWAPRTSPYQTRVFWPAYLDSLVWLDSSTWAALDRGVASSGANRLLEEALDRLRRWAAFEPDQARPERELALWTLSLRSRIQGPHPPSLADSLSGEAIEHLSRALSLSVDTTRTELFHLANLLLATGDILSARSAWEFALERDAADGAEGISPAASNVLLYSGRPIQALTHLASEPSRTIYHPDPVTGEVVDDGGAEPLIQKLLILGATGVSGPPLESALLDLMDRWTAVNDRTERQTNLLRTVTAPRIAVALWLEPAFLESWTTDLDLRDPLWAALMPEVEGREALVRAALEADEWEVKDPTRSFLLGAAAHEVGEDTLAIRLFSRLDSLTYRIYSRDPGWGLRSLSYFFRGRAYEATDDPGRATQFYRRFIEAWSEPDIPIPLAQEARRRLAELSR